MNNGINEIKIKNVNPLKGGQLIKNKILERHDNNNPRDIGEKIYKTVINVFKNYISLIVT